ncbi:hypothetical protein GMSM_29500 [Geomonas sp. Red276]
MGERLVLETAPQEILLGDQGEITYKTQHPQNLNVGPHGDRGVAGLHLVEGGARDVGAGADGFH